MPSSFPTLRRLLPAIGFPVGPGRRSAAVLRLLAACRSEGIPPAPLLAAWARDERGGQATRVAAAARLLADGATVSEVIDRVPDLVNADHAVAVRYGERIGRLPETVAATLAGDVAAGTERGVRAGLAYIGVVCAVFALVTTLLAVRVLPQFRRIFHDFGMEEPRALTVGAVAAELWVTVAIGLMLLGLVVAIGSLIPPLARSCTRLWGAWSQRPRREAAALDLLAVATRAGIPQPEAARLLVECQTDRGVARRLATLSGSETASLARAGLVTPAEERYVEAATTAGDRAGALAGLAGARRARSAAGRLLASRLVAPLAAALMGAFVLVEALAVFVPLVRLVVGLT